MSSQHSSTLGDICTPLTLVQENPDLLTSNQMLWLLKTRDQNGLSKSGAVLKVSRKIYLVRGKFLEWFLDQKVK